MRDRRVKGLKSSSSAHAAAVRRSPSRTKAIIQHREKIKGRISPLFGRQLGGLDCLTLRYPAFHQIGYRVGAACAPRSSFTREGLMSVSGVNLNSVLQQLQATANQAGPAAAQPAAPAGWACGGWALGALGGAGGKQAEKA